MSDCVVLELLHREDWGEYEELLRAFRGGRWYSALREALNGLKREALYASPVHGEGHIERTMLYGALCCMAQGLEEPMTRLVLEACAYHDVGREDDRYDEEHGYRSSLQIAGLTGRTGRELELLRAAVTAHSRRDPDFDGALDVYGLAGDDQARHLAKVLKDADGLDRVRVNDLDVNYLRYDADRAFAPLAYAVYRRYQQAVGLEAIPLYPPQVLEMVRSSPGGGAEELLWNRPAFFDAARRIYRGLAEQGRAPDLPETMLKYFKFTDGAT